MDRVDYLTAAARRGESIAVVHYACENLHKATDRPPAVSSIVVRVLNGATRVFSRASSPVGTDPTTAEVTLLDEYFEFLQSLTGHHIVHWNMGRVSFGFAAIENRYRYLTSRAPSARTPSSSLFDLDDLIEQRYGADYVGHPKLSSLALLNGLRRRDAKDGAEEADLFEQSNFGAIDRSTEEKVSWICKLLALLVDGQLDTLRSAGTVSVAGVNVDAVSLIVTLGQRMLYVQRELTRRHGGRPTLTFKDEYDDQDLYRALLRLFFEDVRPEDPVPTTAGASSRIDFVLPAAGIAVELKHTRAGMTAKDVGDQLAADVARYATHSAVRHLVCLVFDHDGLLSNPRGLESDLAREKRVEGLAVTVAIVDR